MDVDANMVIEELKRQRNEALDDAAMLRALVRQLQDDSGGGE